MAIRRVVTASVVAVGGDPKREKAPVCAASKREKTSAGGQGGLCGDDNRAVCAVGGRKSRGEEAWTNG